LFKNIERFGADYYFKDHLTYHLIGDSAFSLKTWLITPYRGDNLSRAKKHHNYCLSSERVKIEHAFGAYKGRWRRVQYINTYNICKAIEIATVAAVLHNFCIVNKDVWADNLFYENLPLPLLHPNMRHDHRQGILKRDMICETLNNNR